MDLDALDVQDEIQAGLVPGALVAWVSLAVEGREVFQDVQLEAETGVLKEPMGRMVQVVAQTPAPVAWASLAVEGWRAAQKAVKAVAYYLGHDQDPGRY